MSRLSFDDARHIVGRMTFGPEMPLINQLVGKSRQEAVNILLKQPSERVPNPPSFTPWRQLDSMAQRSGLGKKKAKMQMRKEGKRLKAWWLRQMLSTKAPVQERLTLFWHNIFTSSLEKVEQPLLMHRQNTFLRSHALDNYRKLVHAIARDPAMLIYLDGADNVKAKPNENFARELLELFTMGRGHYSEGDVKAAAVAFTGWGVDRYRGTHYYARNQHATKKVRFLGQSAVYNGVQIIDRVLSHKRPAEYIAERMWHEFVSDEKPTYAVLQRWGNAFRSSNYDVKTLLKTMLLSNEFWHPRYRGTLTKSPIDLIIGSYRSLPYPKMPVPDLLHIAELLGQDIMDPPSVKGWDGGKEWIDSRTLLIRTSFLTKLTRKSAASAQVEKYLPDTSGANVVKWLLPTPPALPLPRHPGKSRMVRALVLDPAYNLK